MLQELTIENLAVIQKVSLTFSEGFTILTGQTGAGKSILIDGINLVLGERGNKELVRTGATKARVEAVFSNLSAQTRRQLSDFGYEVEDDTILLSREITVDGKSQSRLQGRPVTTAMVRELAVGLLNIHGQHDNQVLLNPKKHLGLLDLFSANHALLTTYQTAYRQFSALKKEYLGNEMDEKTKQYRLELLTHEVEEIAQVEDLLTKEEALLAAATRMRAAKKLYQAVHKAYGALFGEEDQGGGYDAFLVANSTLKPVVGIDGELDRLAEGLEAVSAELQEQRQAMTALLHGLAFDEEQLWLLEDQLTAIRELKRKYGGSVEAVFAHYQKASAELSGIVRSDERSLQLEQQMRVAKEAVVASAKVLSESRRQAAKSFEAQLMAELRFLDMPNIAFTVDCQPTKYGVMGNDQVEFLFSTNQGETPKPIHKIASGGELSRVMLALRCVLAEGEAVGTLIFDEIDAGVSGSSAGKIGKKLLQVAGNRQVLCVTHSAQIAALAHHNLLIEKSTVEGQTFTEVQVLDKAGKIAEVARIMATDKVTDLMMQTATAMVEEGNRLHQN